MSCDASATAVSRREADPSDSALSFVRLQLLARSPAGMWTGSASRWLIGALMRTVQMTLDERLVDRVDRAARRLGTSRSAFTRDALRDAPRVATLQKERPPPGYEARPVAREFDLVEGAGGPTETRRRAVERVRAAGQAAPGRGSRPGLGPRVSGRGQPSPRSRGRCAGSRPRSRSARTTACPSHAPSPRSRPDGCPRPPRRARDDALHAADGRESGKPSLFALDLMSRPAEQVVHPAGSSGRQSPDWRAR